MAGGSSHEHLWLRGAEEFCHCSLFLFCQTVPMTGKVTQGSVAVPPGSWLVLEDVFCLSRLLRSQLPELVGCLPSWFNHLPLPSGEEHVQGSSPEPVPVPKKVCRKSSYQQELSPMAQKQTGDLLHMQWLPVHHGRLGEASRSAPSIQKPRQCLG